MLPRSGETGRNELPALPSHCGTGDSRPLHYDDVPGESAFAVQSRLRSGLVDFLRPRRSTLRPKRDRHPCEVIEGFVDQNPAGCVVLLDGVESIMNNIGFDKDMLFVQHMNEYVMSRKAVVLFTVDPECFRLSEFARLERSLKSIDEPQLRQALDNPEHYPRTGIR